MRGVVDDESQRLVAELVVKNRCQSLAVCLVNAVVQEDAFAEAALRDQLIEGFNAVGLQVNGDELARWSYERRQRSAPAGGNPQLDEVLTLEAFDHLEIPLDPAGILLDREEPTAGPLESTTELNVADAEVWSRARDPRAVFTIRVGLRVDPGERTAFGAAAAAWGSGDLASPL